MESYSLASTYRAPPPQILYPPPHAYVQQYIKQEPSLSPPAQDPHAKAAKLHREHLRKVSHSAIERRRRERINDKILQLKDLVPSCTNQENLHKLSILQNAIEYIHALKSQIEEQTDQLASSRNMASPPQAPHPSFERSSASSLPSPAASHRTPAAPRSFSSTSDDDEHAGAHDLLLLATGGRHHRVMPASPEPAQPFFAPLHQQGQQRPKPMSVDSLLC
ncbi:hypothetical protein HKX48_008786 [Thoreauomyces humboldtii]|nr:hypothetical protein HKX48_008786 [Thoreauomyces humboldtii]